MQEDAFGVHGTITTVAMRMTSVRMLRSPVAWALLTGATAVIGSVGEQRRPLGRLTGGRSGVRCGLRLDA